MQKYNISKLDIICPIFINTHNAKIGLTKRSILVIKQLTEFTDLNQSGFHL